MGVSLDQRYSHFFCFDSKLQLTSTKQHYGICIVPYNCTLILPIKVSIQSYLCRIKQTDIKMEQDFVLKIGNEIYRQIRCGVTMDVIMSWGVSKRIATVYNDMATLALRVSGVLHKGWVNVSLDEGRDVYIVTLLSADKKKVISVHDEVYCEDLGSLIDSLVERETEWTDEEYKKLAIADSERKLN